MKHSCFTAGRLLLLALLAGPLRAGAQTPGVAIGSGTPHASAVLDIVATDKGLLLPRLTAAQRAGIAEPAAGLLVYQTNGAAGFWYNAGSAQAPSWQHLNVVGGPGDNLGSHLAGTNLGLGGHWLSNAPGNANGLRIDNAGNVGIGTGSPAQKLEVAGQVYSTSGGFRFPDNTVQATAAPAEQTLSLNGQDLTISGAGGNTVALPLQPGDNLGSHLASQGLNLQNHALLGNGGNLGAAVGLGVTAAGGLNIGQNTEGNNLYLGYQSGRDNTTGSQNQFSGFQSGRSNTTGYHNLFAGYRSGLANTEGYDNVYLGYQSGQAGALATSNVFIGANSGLANTEGQSCVFIGEGSGMANTNGNYNVFVGEGCGESNTTGYTNVFMGRHSGIANTTGNSNVFIGTESGPENTTGQLNVFTGYKCGFRTTTGGFNVFSGYLGGQFNETGSNNTGVGNGAGPAQFSTSLSNTTAVGNGATVSVSNKVRLGNTAVTVIEGQVPYSFPSDARFKYQVQANVPGLAFIRQLRPVTYRFDAAGLDAFQRSGRLPAACILDTAAAVQTGFLAQEVEQAAQKLGYRFDGVHRPAHARDHYSLAYSQFVMPLVQAVQELSQEVETLKARNAALEARAAQAGADHAALLTLQQQVARLVNEAAPAQARR